MPDLAGLKLAIAAEDLPRARLIGRLLRDLGARGVTLIADYDCVPWHFDTMWCDVLVLDTEPDPAAALRLVRALRRKDRARPDPLPVLLMVREATRGYVIAARTAGARAVLVRPVTHIHLARGLARCLDRPVPSRPRAASWMKPDWWTARVHAADVR